MVYKLNQTGIVKWTRVKYTKGSNLYSFSFFKYLIIANHVVMYTSRTKLKK